MRWLRAALAGLLLLGGVGVGSYGSGSAASAAGAPDGDAYDRLKSGGRVVQEREYDIPEKPTVYLTFDDGPGSLTPQVLDILKDAGVKATFFVLGEMVYKYPDTIRRMAEEGHAVGNHTYNHQYAGLYPQFKLFWDQVRRTDQALAETAGISTSLVRAPGGTSSHFDAFYFYYLEQAGYSVFDWNVDSGDSKKPNVPMQDILRTVKNTPLKHEMIVLMHDSSGHGESVRALPEVIRFYQEQGYEFGVLSPRVKPIQQSLTIKNAAPVSRAEHETWLQTVQAVAAEKKPAVPEPAPVVEEVPAVKAALAPPLRLHLEQAEWEMAGSDYELRHDKLFVPLRPLVEHMGGATYWDEARRTAVVRYGMQELRIDLQRHAVTLEVSGRPSKVYSLTDVSLRDGAIFVPLRFMIELVGGEVESYSFTDEMREVTLDMGTHGYLLTPPPRLTWEV